MILMCIDHARDYTSIFPSDPMDLSQTPMWLFALRVLSHLCAPTFILLSGISAGITSKRKSQRELSQHLISRGAILCLHELTLVNWGWSFNPLYNTIYLQVIWAIGISMMLLGVMIHLPKRAILGTSVAILALHNLFSGVHFGDCSALHYGWSFTLQKNLLPIFEGLMVRTTYPVLPVFATMGIGYSLATWFTDLDPAKRKRNLWTLSGAMLFAFVLLRVVIGYGDAHLYQSEYPIMSIFNLTKYPLSLNFVLLYLSFATAFLALSEGWRLSERNVLIVLGRVPMFFYIVHLYLLHIIILGYLIAAGYTLDFGASLGAVPSGVGYPAWWLWWIIPFVVAAMYLPCRWYYGVKLQHKFWISKYI